MIAANVSVRDCGLNPSSSFSPGTSSPPCQPPVYWPCAVVSLSGWTSWVALSTLIFSSRSSLDENETGSSIAVNARSCSRWFWITSRAAPMPS